MREKERQAERGVILGEGERRKESPTTPSCEGTRNFSVPHTSSWMRRRKNRGAERGRRVTRRLQT
jgi:hypothetical protein